MKEAASKGNHLGKKVSCDPRERWRDCEKTVSEGKRVSRPYLGCGLFVFCHQLTLQTAMSD